jgi:hypothetical protein
MMWVWKKLRGREETSTISDSTHHKVFENIRDDEYEHIVTMKAGFFRLDLQGIWNIDCTSLGKPGREWCVVLFFELFLLGEDNIFMYNIYMVFSQSLRLRMLHGHSTWCLDTGCKSNLAMQHPHLHSFTSIHTEQFSMNSYWEFAFITMVDYMKVLQLCG